MQVVDQHPLSLIHAFWGRLSWSPSLALYNGKPTSDATEYRVILNDRPTQRLWLPWDEIECIAYHTHTATKDTIPNHGLSEIQTSNLLLTRQKHPRYYPLPSATSQIATRTVTATHKTLRYPYQPLLNHNKTLRNHTKLLPNHNKPLPTLQILQNPYNPLLNPY